MLLYLLMREHGPPQLLHLLVSCVLLGDNIRGLEGLILVYAIFLPSDYCTVFADYYGSPLIILQVAQSTPVATWSRDPEELRLHQHLPMHVSTTIPISYRPASTAGVLYVYINTSQVNDDVDNHQ